MLLVKVITGGQTGADQAGWRAAQAAGLATGGWMPKGYLTEDGLRPEFAERYGAQECPSRTYPPRTARNATEADATVFFGSQSSGYWATYYACGRRPFYWHDTTTEGPECAADLAQWLTDLKVRTLNVAGNRESRAPGIGAFVERYLAEVFRLLKSGVL